MVSRFVRLLTFLRRSAGQPSFLSVRLGFTLASAGLLAGCGATLGQMNTLQPIPALLGQLILRAAAADQLILAVGQKVAPESLHPLEQTPISLGGLGPIQLGMTIQEAADAAQVAFSIAPNNLAEGCRYYFPEVYDSDTGEEPLRQSIDGIGVMTVNEKIIRIDIWPGSPVKTLSGIGIGDSTEQVKAVYESQLEVAPNPYTKGSYLTLTPEASGSNLFSLVFETDQAGQVVQFRTGQFPAVNWAEGCS